MIGVAKLLASRAGSSEQTHLSLLRKAKRTGYYRLNVPVSEHIDLDSIDDRNLNKLNSFTDQYIKSAEILPVAYALMGAMFYADKNGDTYFIKARRSISHVKWNSGVDLKWSLDWSDDSKTNHKLVLDVTGASYNIKPISDGLLITPDSGTISKIAFLSDGSIVYQLYPAVSCFED